MRTAPTRTRHVVDADFTMWTRCIADTDYLPTSRCDQRKEAVMDKLKGPSRKLSHKAGVGMVGSSKQVGASETFQGNTWVDVVLMHMGR